MPSCDMHNHLGKQKIGKAAVHWNPEMFSLWCVSTKMGGDHWCNEVMESQILYLKWQKIISAFNSLQQWYFCCLKYIVLPIRLDYTSVARNLNYWAFWRTLGWSLTTNTCWALSFHVDVSKSKHQMEQQTMPNVFRH